MSFFDLSSQVSEREKSDVSSWISVLRWEGKNKERLAPLLRELKTCHWELIYVPSLHPARYSSCSGVSLSILMPTDSSLSLATRLSRSSGTLWTVFSSVL